jgi:hypothetical protein
MVVIGTVMVVTVAPWFQDSGGGDSAIEVGDSGSRSRITWLASSYKSTVTKLSLSYKPSFLQPSR